MSYSFDAEVFIREVKKYPTIWDPNCEENKLKDRQQAWEEIARVFIDDFDELSKGDKIDVYKELSKKWRNIRDGYVRGMKRKCGKKYMYAKLLTFLDDKYKNQSRTTSDDQEETNDDWPSDDDNKLKTILYKNFKTEEPVWDEPDVKKRRKNIEYVETFPDLTPNASEDEDRSFFNSLLPAIRDFDTDQKLEFRSDIIKLVKQYRKKSRNLRISNDNESE